MNTVPLFKIEPLHIEYTHKGESLAPNGKPFYMIFRIHGDVRNLAEYTKFDVIHSFGDMVVVRFGFTYASKYHWLPDYNITQG